MDLRLRKAVTLLQRKDLKICDIALKSGFNDLSEFNKQFKKLYGSPPSSFREPVW
jgi:AraC-like DNA-binding protein